jgi:hypothetical protein
MDEFYKREDLPHEMNGHRFDEKGSDGNDPLTDDELKMLNDLKERSLREEELLHDLAESGMKMAWAAFRLGVAVGTCIGVAGAAAVMSIIWYWT